jgi:hypothetical protein
MKLGVFTCLIVVPLASALVPSRALPAARSHRYENRYETSARPMKMNLAADLLKLVGGTKKVLSDADARDKYGVQLPKYESIMKDGYELRRYQPMTVVQTP